MELKEAIERCKNITKHKQDNDLSLKENEAIDTILEELNEEKALHHNIRLELTQIKKDLDFEPWSTYKVAGTRLFNMVGLLNKE